MYREYIIDSGCTAHMTPDHSEFSSYSNTTLMKIDLGANSSADVGFRGDITLALLLKGERTKVSESISVYFGKVGY